MTTSGADDHVRKHPAPEGALRLVVGCDRALGSLVRKHPAPEGALRHIARQPKLTQVGVRKHPAPEGALRLLVTVGEDGGKGQKAPSTRRCIKTLLDDFKNLLFRHVRKHPAPEGA